jgi:hypothetical protein
MNTITPLGLCYHLPAGDFTFMTRFRQQYWGVCQGECHRAGSTVMLTNSIDKPTAYIATLSAAALSGPRQGIDLWHQLSSESYPSESAPVLPLGIVAANVVPSGNGILIKITCVKGTYSFFGSADSVTWQQIGTSMKDAFAYVCLINVASPDGWDEFDFGEVLQAGTDITNRSLVRPKYSRQVFSQAFSLAHRGLTGASLPTAKAYTLLGSIDGYIQLSSRPAAGAQGAYILKLNR